jgi:hypothetical protein
MALTVTEASAVNTLIDYLLGNRNALGGPDRLDARQAAELLADHANKTLSAGVTGSHVRQDWHRVPRRVGEEIS